MFVKIFSKYQGEMIINTDFLLKIRPPKDQWGIDNYTVTLLESGGAREYDIYAPEYNELKRRLGVSS